jgi:cytochrome c oxidase subunit 4
MTPENFRETGEAPSGRVRVHVVSLPILVGVFVSLIGFTVLTVAATKIDLGAGNLWVAILIAGIKATLVALYFMHLRYDRPFHGFIFLGGILFVVLFIGLALMDTQAYDPALIPDYAPGIEQ